MDDFCIVADTVNDTLEKYAEDVPVLTIKFKRYGYTVVSKILYNINKCIYAVCKYVIWQYVYQGREEIRSLMLALLK